MLFRGGVMLGILAVLFLSQRFWYRALWRVTSNWGRVWLRLSVRILYFAGLVGIILTITDGLRQRIIALGAASDIISGGAIAEPSAGSPRHTAQCN